ncbi:MAG: DMT family transporter [Devosia sp.]|uniref:DMT family transporter n=1 Tax=Devosia sp. TaxID=1871048 RepID=UPI0024C54985|nr:DMT family transporter [Devosia sp.]UYN99390.1 MAG: DMT family transporter [Devosia sp.]
MAVPQDMARPLLGIGLAVLATVLFAAHDVVNKHLLASYDVPLVSAMRYLVHLMLMVAILGPVQGRQLVTTQRTGLVVVRALCLVVATLFMGLALQLMPLAETTAIIYLSPIMVVLLARPILGEQIGLFGWIGAIGGFVGVLLIVRPGGGLDPLGVVFALCNVGVTVAYYLLSRILARSEKTLALLFYSALAGAVCFGLLAPWYWFGTMPSALDLLLFASLGVLAALGHYCFTAAYRHAPASVLAPISYAHLLWAGVLGWIVFNQFPDAIGLAGMGLIGAAGVLVALHSSRRRKG